MAADITDTTEWESVKKEAPTSTHHQQNNSSNTTTASSSSASSKTFTDLLVSGGEIEGMFQHRRKQEKDRKTSKKSITNGLKDPVTLLKERLSIYNNKREEKYHLTLNEEDLSYSGLLKFQYHNGYQMFHEDFQVKNEFSVSKLLPVLLSRFLPQYEFTATQTEASNSYIVLTQEGTERELDRAEKPLEVALDCSLKGLSSPTFTLKTSVSLLLQLPNTPQNLRKKLSSLSLTASSHSSLGHGSSEGSESPRIIEAKSIADDDSLYSFSSSAPSYSSYTHPPRSASSGGRSLLKSISQSNASKQKMLELSHGKMSDNSLNSPVGTPTSLTPDKRTKSKVGNFMEGFARTLKSKRKTRPASIYPEEPIDLRNAKKLSHESLTTNERRYSMPTVFHIHFSNAKNAQLYKSVLVSENSTTLEVIKQALDRYSMKFADPSEFCLYEVIGRWEAITMDSMESGLEQSLGALVTPLSPGNSNDSKNMNMPAFEEFVVYYTRELKYEEQPYDVQFFHQAPEGYTRRFELRSKSEDEFESSKTLSQEVPVPTTPVFGATSHNSKRHFVSKDQEVTFTLSSPSSKSVDKDEETLSRFQSFLDCSSPDGEIDDTHEKATNTTVDQLYSTAIDSPYLLNLQLNCTREECFVYRLPFGGSDNKVALVANNSFITSFQDHHRINLQASEDEGPVMCRFYAKNNSKYSIEPHNAAVLVNGTKTISSVELLHGDLLQIGQTHLFMYQDFRNHYTLSSDPSWPYQWVPTKTTGKSTSSSPSIGDVRESSPVISQAEVIRIIDTDSSQLPTVATTTNKITQPPPPLVSGTSRDERGSVNRSKLPTVKEIEASDEEERHDLKPIDRRRVQSDSSRMRRISPSSSSLTHQKTSSGQSTSFFIRQQRTKIPSTSDAPSDHAVLYSYVSSTKLDHLFRVLIKQIEPKSVSFPLAPAYVLAMCLDYSLKCDTSNSTACLFVSNAVQVLQQVVTDITSQLVSWQPSPTSNCSPLTEIHHLLYSVLFWFSNCLEIYNFLVNRGTLNIIALNEKEEENPLTLLENMILKLFQQVFYPVSKALYAILPMMFEEVLNEDVHQSSCVMQTIECLKEILEMMLELHVHTEIIAHFFTNTFFFLNGAMFNTLIDQALHMELFQYSKGIKLKMSLDKLEGWAGRVGFRDIVYQFFGTFLSAIDLIAVSPEELTTLSWQALREEFPCLHPTQLNFILSHYILPENIKGFVVSWTPSTDDSLQAANKDMLHESFECHPNFYLPIGGYSLDLNSRQSQEDSLLQQFIDSVECDLNKITSETAVMSSDKTQEKPSKTSLDVPDISKGKTKGSRSHKSKNRQKLRHKMNVSPNHPEDYTDSIEGGPAELRGRVKSIVEPQLMTLPEKLVILSQEEEEETEESSDEILEHSGMMGTFPKGSHAVSLQRGHKGFGFTLEEKKGCQGLFVKIDDTELILDEYSDLQDGAQVLAVDDLYICDTDFATIQKYIKEAEEEISIVLAPKH